MGMGMDIHFVTRVDMGVASVVFAVVVLVPTVLVFVQTAVPMGMGMGVGMDVVMHEIAVPVFVAVQMAMLVGMGIFDRLRHASFPSIDVPLYSRAFSPSGCTASSVT
jgi:hypothetical protein